MSQFVETPTRTFTASGALGQYLRVKDNGSGKLSLAGVTDRGLGTLENPAFADLDPVAVRLWTAQGTRKMVSSASITAFNPVYGGANGTVAASGSLLIGYAMEAAASGDVFEVLPLSPLDASAGVQSVTADDSDSALNQILPTSNAVTVAGVTNDTDDYVILPALADVPVGHRVLIINSSGGACEVRTPAASDEEINSENCDGTKEYLLASTQLHYFTKIDDTIGWMGNGYTAIGAVATAIVPD